MRLDAYLKTNGMVDTRNRAQMLIDAGAVQVNGVVVTKSAYDVKETDAVTVTDVLRYVSRGGLKLEAALQHFGIFPGGRVAIDVGASSGGFTDCLLQNDARLVYAVDSGTGQLATKLRHHPAVMSMENYNARYMKWDDFAERPTLAVMDVSFISQTLILPSLSSVLSAGGEIVSLIKPQFEVGRAHVGRGGIVRDEKARQMAVEKVIEAARLAGLLCKGTMPSPVLGGDGNHEYLAYFVKQSERM